MDPNPYRQLLEVDVNNLSQPAEKRMPCVVVVPSVFVAHGPAELATFRLVLGIPRKDAL